MKRKVYVTIAAVALSWSLMGCRQTSEDVAATEAIVQETSEANTVAEAQETVIGDDEVYPIIDGVVNSKAVWPKEDWSKEEILQSYFDRSAPWYRLDDWDVCYLYSSDYEHEFAIAAGWLYIDDVKALPVASTTHDISPEALSKAFCNGEWNGEEWWSNDYSTTVRLSPYDGRLRYSYESVIYTEKADPLGLAYTEYGEIPSYIMDADANIYGLSNPYEGISSEECNVTVDYFIDIPGGTVSGLRDVCRIEGVGTYALTDHSVELYNAGNLLDIWYIEMSNDACIVPYRYGSEEPIMYTCSYGYLRKLMPDGRNKVVAEGVVYVDNSYESTCHFYYLQNGTLSCLELFSQTETVVDEDVQKVYPGRLFLYRKNDGNMYMLPSDKKELFNNRYVGTKLGTENVDFYRGEFAAYGNHEKMIEAHK